MGAEAELVARSRALRGQSQPVAMDRALAAIADAQHGVVTRSQLLEIGLGPDAVDRRLGRGHLRRLHAGTYAVGHRALAREGRWLAAVLACGPDSVLSHRSAAALWDLRCTTRAAIDVTAPRTRHRRPGLDLHLPRCLAPEQRTEHKRIPCTTVARTLVDLAGVLGRTGIEGVWRRAEMLGLLDVHAVQSALEPSRGRRGAGLIRALLAQAGDDAVTRSELEERFLALCLAASLPRPRVNARVDANGTTYEVDFLWRQHHLVAETDGWGPHHTRAAFESDRRRDADLLVAGLRVVRFTWRQITREPGAVAATLGALLQA
jgi:uncharacterized protein DUF559/putative AbiEi antitoxin of type IV toxin-antitoxin system